MRRVTYFYIVVVYMVIVGVMICCQLHHKTLEEYAVVLETNDYFVSGDCRIWKVHGIEEVEDTLVIVLLRDETLYPINTCVYKNEPAKMTIMEHALTTFNIFEVFVRKDGSVWVATGIKANTREAYRIERYQPYSFKRQPKTNLPYVP